MLWCLTKVAGVACRVKRRCVPRCAAVRCCPHRRPQPGRRVKLILTARGRPASTFAQVSGQMCQPQMGAGDPLPPRARAPRNVLGLDGWIGYKTSGFTPNRTNRKMVHATCDLEPHRRNMARMTANQESDFWAVGYSVNENGCWIWGGRTGRKGYGVFCWAAGQTGAHRLAWRFTHGDPGGNWVLHHCDNPPCINPAHLFLGDHEINVADKVAKGRQAAGAEHGRAKVTTEQVAEIRRRYVPSSGAGRPDGNKDDLGREFGLHPKQIYKIWRGLHRTTS